MMRKKMSILLFFVISCGIAQWGQAQAATVCFQCHEESSFVKRVVHEPLGKGQCSACHNPHVARYQGLLQKDGAELCYSCHEDKKEAFAEAIIHPPVKQGRCLTCHEPHASDSRGLIRGELAERCFACHGGIRKTYTVKHRPFDRGQCSVCHWPHNADNAQFLKGGGVPGKVCVSCHSRTEVKQVHKNFPTEIKGCLTCHNPHGSNRKHLIRDLLHVPYKDDCGVCHGRGTEGRAGQTCLDCHQEVADKAMASLHNHLTGGQGNGCIVCHSPHAGDGPGLIKGRPGQICRQCHLDTFKKHEENIYSHLTLVKTCYSCHEVHGSNRPAMLKADGVGVCMNCHEDQGSFSHPVGAKAKDPRTGLEMGCISCHNPHGTDFKGQLKLSGASELCVLCHHM